MTTYFVGAHYEVIGSTVTKYYFASIQRVAMKQNGTLYYPFSHHLGSTTITTRGTPATLAGTAFISTEDG